MSGMKADESYVIYRFSDKELLNDYIIGAKIRGLSNVEKHVFKTYVSNDCKILDLGCGTGRTTFGLYKEGYKNIEGIDLTPVMIQNAKILDKDYFKYNLSFEVGNAKDIKRESNTYDIVYFSYNGLMQIPERKNRIKALHEINRILKDNGLFLFTSMNVEKAGEISLDVYNSLMNDFDNYRSRSYVYEPGDYLIADGGYMHLNSVEDMITYLNETGFEVILSKYSLDICEEKIETIDYSKQTQFWVVKKVRNSKKIL